MIIKSYAELREPDQRTLGFLPNGLGVGLAMFPEDSAQYWQEVVARFALDAAVAEGTRRSFDDLRIIFPHGLFCYEIFTLIDNQALLVLEQALRDRFIDYHGGSVTFTQGTTIHRVSAGRYEDVLTFLNARRRPQPRLALSDSSDSATIEFNGMLGGLLRWARKAGLLAGQRNRAVEAALNELRNSVAHPSNYHLLMPVDAARTLRDLAEIINRLWGVETPGGRLYPAPINRYPVVIAWNPTSGSLCTTLAANLSDPASWDGYTKYAIVQSVWPDETGMLEPRLGQYDSRYETTPYPTDYLWGPGSREEAIAWLDTAQPEPDTCTTLDRLFIVRAEAGVVFQAMRPAIAAGLPEDATGGHWYLVRADAPIHAFHHVRQLEAGVSTCALTGLCACCPVETLSHGVYRTVLAAADADELRGLPLPPDFAVAVPLPVPRSLPVAAT